MSKYTNPLSAVLQILLLALFCLPSTHLSAQVDNELIGEWFGVVDQPGFGTYETEMRIDSMVVNEPSGATEYPTLSCGGDNFFLENMDSLHIFSEVITFGGNCVDGRIEIVKLSSDTIQWDWYFTNGTLGAFGKLARQASTGIAKLPQSTITLYPNPAAGAFVLRSPQASIQSLDLYDLTGRRLPAAIEHTRHEAHISSQYRGLSIVKVQTDEGMWIQRVLLK